MKPQISVKIQRKDTFTSGDGNEGSKSFDDVNSFQKREQAKNIIIEIGDIKTDNKNK